MRKRVRRRRDRIRRTDVKVSMPGNVEVAVTYLKEGVAVVLDHHIFDSRAGWVKRQAWKQPTMRLAVRPCGGIYSKLNTHTPDAGPMVVDGIADTGAQVCL